MYSTYIQGVQYVCTCDTCRIDSSNIEDEVNGNLKKLTENISIDCKEQGRNIVCVCVCVSMYLSCTHCPEYHSPRMRMRV